MTFDFKGVVTFYSLLNLCTEKLQYNILAQSVKHLQRYINEFCLRQNIVGDLEKSATPFCTALAKDLYIEI